MILEADGLTVRYGNGALGVSDVTISADQGEIVAILGPNGAGKTTTVRAMSGFLRTEGARVVRGRVRIDGQDLTNREPHNFARAGVSFIPERLKVFPNLTVVENLASASNGKRHSRERLSEIYEMFPILGERHSQLAGRMSGGQQQMLAIARSLMRQAKVLIIDELTLGLHVSMQPLLAAAIKRIASEGMAVIVVDESVDFAMDLADRAYVLRGGVVAESGRSEDLRSGMRIAAGYVGGPGSSRLQRSVAVSEPEDNERRAVAGGSKEVLSVQDLTVRFGGVLAVDKVSLAVSPGQVVAVIGPNGAGKSTVINGITGVVPSTGSVRLHGESIDQCSRRQIAELGIRRSFQHPYVLERESVLENVMCGAHLSLDYGLGAQVFRRRHIGKLEREVGAEVRALLEQLHLLEGEHEPASALPYGRRKLLDIARALVADPVVVILDEPSSGLDGRERDTLRSLLEDIVLRRNLPLLIVEHDLDLVKAIADHVIGLHAGQVLVEGTPEEVLESERYLAAVTGSHTR